MKGNGKRFEDYVRISNYFFTEISYTHGAMEMYNIFKDFGEIEEVVIPPKWDKRRKWYSFVRFRNVENERMLATKVDNIIINRWKVYTNIPRFQRGR